MPAGHRDTSGPAPFHPNPGPGVAHAVIRAALDQVGVHEGRSGGHWNNGERYAGEVPGLAWANFQPWCAVFVAWCARRGGAADLFPVTASTDYGARWFQQANRWSEYPAVGAQVFYGHEGDMVHTGLVVGYDEQEITTVEGNTNNTGSPEGDGVYLRVRRRRDDFVRGYGYPAYPEGIVSADPAEKWQQAAPKRRPRPTSSTPTTRRPTSTRRPAQPTVGALRAALRTIRREILSRRRR